MINYNSFKALSAIDATPLGMVALSEVYDDIKQINFNIKLNGEEKLNEVMNIDCEGRITSHTIKSDHEIFATGFNTAQFRMELIKVGLFPNFIEHRYPTLKVDSNTTVCAVGKIDDTTHYEYDDDGNVIRIYTDSGFEEKYLYVESEDEYVNITTINIEFSDGYKCNMSVDQYGTILSLKDSNGIEYSYTFTRWED